jgi:hypothetical protein
MITETEAPQTTDARAQITRIAQSKVFRSSEVLRHLFTYLAEKSLEGAIDELKEYAIGVAALGKPDSFDPRQESVVRMHTARIRQKLSDYYNAEGAQDPLVVEMPKGGFVVTFTQREQAPAAPAASPKIWLRRETILLAALSVAVCCAIALVIELWRTSRAKTQYTAGSGDAGLLTPALRDLWSPLLSPERRLVICVSTPLFVNVPGFGLVREPTTIDWEDATRSKQLDALENAVTVGAREPSYSYTEAGTATGAFLLGQFLAPRKRDVVVTRSNVISWPEIAEANVIFLGSSAGVRQTDDIPADAQFILDPTGLRNLMPHRGEAAFLADETSDKEGDGLVTYALISRVPAMSGPGAILILSGNQTASVVAGVKAFTTPELAQALVSQLKSASGTVPRFFQVVLKVKARDDVPMRIDYLLSRELPNRTQTSARR